MRYKFLHTILENFSKEYRVYLEVDTGVHHHITARCGICKLDDGDCRVSHGHNVCDRWVWEKDI